MPLESSPEHPQPLRTVSHLVRGWVERLGAVWVEAQLIEINRRSGSRTVFLTLRDKLAEVSASVTISPATLDTAGPLTEGATVVARLKPGFYEASGRFSFACDAITVVGEGRLLARLEQTKRLLQAEGLFDPALKKSLPFLPGVVGLVTGAGSAAERDVVENARRRWPAVRFAVRHALVQGPQAAAEVMAAITGLDQQSEVDVIVVARGGGSLEDLLPFSDEGLIRVAYRCRTPLVSAIGHDSDTPILDLVADVRASTPTDAAKRVVPDAAEEAARVAQARGRIRPGAPAPGRARAGEAERDPGPTGAGGAGSQLRTTLRPVGEPAAPLRAGGDGEHRARAGRGTASPGEGAGDVPAGHAGTWLRHPARAGGSRLDSGRRHRSGRRLAGPTRRRSAGGGGARGAAVRERESGDETANAGATNDGRTRRGAT